MLIDEAIEFGKTSKRCTATTIFITIKSLVVIAVWLLLFVYLIVCAYYCCYDFTGYE